MLRPNAFQKFVYRPDLALADERYTQNRTDNEATF